jgi:hypothetical protein
MRLLFRMISKKGLFVTIMFIIALEYAIRNIQENYERLECLEPIIILFMLIVLIYSRKGRDFFWSVNCVQSAQGTVRWRALLNTVKHFLMP